MVNYTIHVAASCASTGTEDSTVVQAGPTPDIHVDSLGGPYIHIHIYINNIYIYMYRAKDSREELFFYCHVKTGFRQDSPRP